MDMTIRRPALHVVQAWAEPFKKVPRGNTTRKNVNGFNT